MAHLPERAHPKSIGARAGAEDEPSSAVKTAAPITAAVSAETAELPSELLTETILCFAPPIVACTALPMSAATVADSALPALAAGTGAAASAAGAAAALLAFWDFSRQVKHMPISEVMTAWTIRTSMTSVNDVSMYIVCCVRVASDESADANIVIWCLLWKLQRNIAVLLGQACLALAQG